MCNVFFYLVVGEVVEEHRGGYVVEFFVWVVFEDVGGDVFYGQIGVEIAGGDEGLFFYAGEVEVEFF